MKWARYDLRWNSPSFDIFTFIQYVRAKGLDAVYLVPGFNGQQLYRGDVGERKRVKTIVIPALELHGIHWQLGGEEPEISWPAMGEKQRYVHRMNNINLVKEPAKLSLPQEALDKANDRLKGKRPIVVIRRNVDYEPYRNTSVSWKRWAADHEAYVVPDYYVEEIPLAERLACYELSSLCMGVNCGNMAPNYYSYRPYISMKWLADPKLKKHGIYEGWTLPWQTKKQKFVWNSDDEYKTIEREYQTYMAENG